MSFFSLDADDISQCGHACVSAGAAAISRVLLPFYDPAKPVSEWSQTSERQIEMLGDLKDYFTLTNGYITQVGRERTLYPQNPGPIGPLTLAEIKEAQRLKAAEEAEKGITIRSTEEMRDELLAKTKVCVHVGTDALFGERDMEDGLMNVVEPQDAHKICQVFCGAINFKQGDYGFGNGIFPDSKFKSRLLLKAAYKGAYLAAIRHGCKKLYLNPLGTGVFGIETTDVFDAIRAVHEEIGCDPRNTTLQEVHFLLYSQGKGLREFLHYFKDRDAAVYVMSYDYDEKPIYYDKFA